MPGMLAARPARGSSCAWEREKRRHRDRRRSWGVIVRRRRGTLLLESVHGTTCFIAGYV